MFLTKNYYLALVGLALGLLANYGHTLTCSASSDSWNNGHVTTVTVINNGSSSVSSWNVKVHFDSAPNIKGSWNVELHTVGNTVEAKSIGWNGNLSPGQSTSFGIQGTHSGSFLNPSCSSGDNPGPGLELGPITLEMRSYKKPCFGMFQRLCNITDNNGHFFYAPIERFNFSWGHQYNLLVDATEIENPPMDASNIRYVLTKVVSDIEDSVGTVYEYEQVELLEQTFTKRDGSYYFLRQPFQCSNEVNCDALIASNNSGRLFNVSFQYLGNGEIALTSWN